MARPKLKRATVGSKYVAIGALAELLGPIFVAAQVGDFEEASHEFAEDIARRLVAAAYDVEHFPVANKVQITLDLQALDKPADAPQ